ARVLRLEIRDHLTLLLVDPACKGNKEEPERVRQWRHDAQRSRSDEERPHGSNYWTLRGREPERWASRRKRQRKTFACFRRRRPCSPPRPSSTLQTEKIARELVADLRA